MTSELRSPAAPAGAAEGPSGTGQATPAPPDAATEPALSGPANEQISPAAPTGAQPEASGEFAYEIEEYPVPPGSHPHDVAPAPDGTVWYTAQLTGELGRLDPQTGETYHIPLGPGSSPHGVIVGPDGAAWITDSGLNAIVRVDPATEAVQVFPLPADTGYANLNTAAFDRDNRLWFTGQSGFYGRLDVRPGQGRPSVEVFRAPGGRGPYGITATPEGEIFYASLAGSHIARIDPVTGAAERIDPPTPNQGARRVWSDSNGAIWVSEWEAGQVGRYDPYTGEWAEWRLPGENPMAYAVYVDERNKVWLSDFGANALVRFDPACLGEDSDTGAVTLTPVSSTGCPFTVIPLPSAGAAVRQILGRPGEVWGAESGVDKLVVVRFAHP